MSTVISRSNPVPIPCNNDAMTFSYKEIVRNLTANAPQPYGAIPPLMKKKKHKPKKKRTPTRPQPAVRRMSHVENWVAVDSKESIPDEEELVHSPFQNFLSMDFLTGILPLHMPPPSLSDPMTLLHQQEIADFTLHHHRQRKGDEDTLDPFAMDPEDEDDEDDEDEDDYGDKDSTSGGETDYSSPPDTSSAASSLPNQKHQWLDTSPPLATAMTTSTALAPAPAPATDDQTLYKDRLPIHSITKSHTPSTSTTTSYVLSSSPPDQDRNKWIHTLAKLRQSIVVSQPLSSSNPSSNSLPSSLSSSPTSVALKTSLSTSTSTSTTAIKRDFIPMPPPPRRKRSNKKRRSEATTQPRFNFDTNTYTRDTRSNPDHLRMIAAELNMMRARKLFSPLKPRGFLPRRKDPFICGEGRPRSPLLLELS